MKRNSAVVFTAPQLGAMDSVEATWFCGTVQQGHSGLYLGKHPNKKLAKDDWHIIKVLRDGYPPWYVPVHRSQFQVKEPLQ